MVRLTFLLHDQSLHWEHSLVFRRCLPRLALEPLPVPSKHPVKGAVVFGAAQGQGSIPRFLGHKDRVVLQTCCQSS
jgi:hypothetical protein